MKVRAKKKKKRKPSSHWESSPGLLAWDKSSQSSSYHNWTTTSWFCIGTTQVYSTEWLDCNPHSHSARLLLEGSVLQSIYFTWGIWHTILILTLTLLSCRNRSFSFSSSSLWHLSALHAFLHSSVSFANVSTCQSRTNIQASRQFLLVVSFKPKLPTMKTECKQKGECIWNN